MPEPCLPHQASVQGLQPHEVFLSRGSNKGEHGKDPNPTTDDAEGMDGGFPMLDGCLMIFGGLVAYDSKHC